MATVRRSIRLAVLLVILVVGLEANVRAETTAEIVITRDASIIWIETTIGSPEPDSTLRVDLMVPRSEDGRELHQSCKFPISGPGPYRCGIEESAVRSDPGRWLAKAYVSSDLIGRKYFSAE
jgi:hypothetical protein